MASSDERRSVQHRETPLLEQLIEALQCLPSVGKKSAQRMALHLLERDRHRGLHLAETLSASLLNIKHCQSCRLHTEHHFCDFCLNHKRDQRQLCITESASDVMAIEQTQLYKGRYFVLHGRISPLDGIGPLQLGCDKLLEMIYKSTDTSSGLASSELLEEVIIACSLTVEGEATTYYLSEAIREYNDQGLGTPIKITRLAQGIPMGSDLELMNGSTLAYALSERKPLR